MSIVKVRLKEVAADLGFAPKEVSEILSRFFEKPKSNSQILTDEELNVLLDYVTQQHQIDSLEQVFAVQAKPAEKKPEPKQEEPKAAPAADKAAAPAASAAGEEAALSLSYPSAVLMEKETGQVLFAQNEHEKLEPASVTKIMTLLLVMEAIDRGELKYEDMVTVSANAASMGGSQVYLSEGEQISVCLLYTSPSPRD